MLRQHWRPILRIGVIASALPFLAFAYAALAINGGLSAILNATTPLWGTLIGWLWLKDRPSGHRLLGLAIGFAGVLWLAADQASFKPGVSGPSSGMAVLACLAAAAMYGLATNDARRHLTGLPPLALAAGSQLGASAVLVLPMGWHWPAQSPGALAWGAAAGLAFLCTGLAYVLYFRLIARIGATNAMTVTFLIPAFAVAWGALLLDEVVSPTMLGACAVILVGTALVTGLLPRRRAAPAAEITPP